MPIPPTLESLCFFEASGSADEGQGWSLEPRSLPALANANRIGSDPFGNRKRRDILPRCGCRAFARTDGLRVPGFLALRVLAGCLLFGSIAFVEEARGAEGTDASKESLPAPVTATIAAEPGYAVGTVASAPVTIEDGEAAVLTASAPWVWTLSDTSLRASWTLPDPTTTSEYRYRAAGTIDWTVVPTDSSTSATITDLAGGTDYEVQTRATRDGGIADWSPSTSARTLEGPGLGNLTYRSSEVERAVAWVDSTTGVPGLSPDSRPLGTNVGAMVNGYFLTVFAPNSGAGPGGFLLYDVSNPRAASLRATVYEPAGSTAEIREAHSIGVARVNGSTYVAVQSTRGVEFWDFTDIDHIRQVSKLRLPGVHSGDYFGAAWQLWWQAPYVYVAASTLGLYVVDATDPERPFVARMSRGRPNPVPPGEYGGFKVGPVFAIGNHLVLASMHSVDGWASLDISDPVDPMLLARTADMDLYYSACFDGRRMFSSPRDAGTMREYDLSDPAAFQYLGTSPLGGDFLYCGVQDGLLLQGGTHAVKKVDISRRGRPRSLGNFRVDGNRDREHGQVTFLGNLVFVGDDHGVGSAFAPHNAAPDRTAPKVVAVSPRNGATGQAVTSRIGIGFSDSILLESVTAGTLRLLDDEGTAVPGTYSAQLGIVNFAPAAPLKPDTAYTVLVPADGLVDYAGNAIASGFRSTFTTRAMPADAPVPAAAGISPATLDSASEVGVPSDFEAVAQAEATYRWDFGDGTSSESSAGPGATHTYGRAGHYTVVLTVTIGSETRTYSTVRTVGNPLTAYAPAASSRIVGGADRVFNVNPHNGTVTAIDRRGLNKAWETRVGRGPSTLALDRRGRVWVAVREDDKLVCVNADGGVCGEIRVGHGRGPYGIAFVPDTDTGLVTLQHSGEVLQFDAESMTVLGRAAVNREPRGIAVAADGGSAYVTQFRSTSEGVVAEIDAATLAPVRRIRMPVDSTTGDAEDRARGRPNYLTHLAVSPDGVNAWVAAKKDNVLRGEFRDGQALTHETTVRAMAGVIDLGPGRELAGRRVDFDDREGPRALAFSPRGDYVFVAMQGSNTIEIVDAYSGSVKGATASGGKAPQGIWIDGEGRQAFVYNFTTRNVSVYDIGDVLDNRSFEPALIRTVGTVAADAFDAETLLGLQVFYDASDHRMSRDGYLSCASCHLEGGEDGSVWDFTDRGEGLRNTISLRGRKGTAHGNLHWTANFDEVQDFENDIRGSFGGTGFLSNADFAATSAPLGSSKAGLSAELDALARYLASLDDFGRSPHRTEAGALTDAARSGRRVFGRQGCAECHSGADFTDRLRHDVGTVGPGSGNAMGQPFGSSGIDTPTLLGVWGTAPYFHDGSAATLDAVIQSGHGIPGTLPAADREALVAFLESLQRPAGEFVQVKVKSGDLCWEAEPAAAAELVLAACNSGEPGQLWRLDADGGIRPMSNDGLCLLTPERVGSPVTLAACDGSDAQRWRFEGDAFSAGARPFEQVISTPRPAHLPDAGTPLVIKNYNARIGQVWHLRYKSQESGRSGDASLATLSLSDADLGFRPDVAEYTVSVEAAVEGVVVEASAGAAGATVEIFDRAGSELDRFAGGPDAVPLTRTVDLVPGTNRIEVEVVAEDEQISRVYGVTVTRDEDPAGRGQPLITGPALFEVLEGDVAVATLAATDADTPATDLRWSIQGGVDSAHFTITSDGALAFAAAKDFEIPDDADTDGSYHVTVQVNDGESNATADLTVALANRNEAPAAYAGPDQGDVAEGATVTLAGSGVDPDNGDTLTFAWTQTDGPEVSLSDPSATEPTFTAPSRLPSDATLAFTLRVTDRAGLHHEDAVAIVVKARPPPVATVAGGTSPVTEGAVATFTVSLDAPAAAALAVAVSVSETGETLSGPPPATMEFAQGEFSKTLSLATVDDLVVEENSTVTAKVTAGTGYMVGTGASASVAVQDDDTAAFTVSVEPETIAEGERATLTVAISNGVTFAENQALGLAVTGTASASDYTLTPASLTLAAGGSSVTTELRAAEDREEEAAETVTIAATRGSVTIGSATVTIESVSHDATLSALSLSGIDIGTFVGSATAYAASVAHDIASTTVTATASHDGASVAIAPGNEVILAEGANEITVTVTAEDGETTRTYTVTVTRAGKPLTARFVGLPETHDGETEFSFELHFSEELDGSFSYVTLRDAALEVTGGTMWEVGQSAPPSNRRWHIRVQPSPEEDLRLVLAATADCEDANAICTGDGRPLSNSPEARVRWVDPGPPAVSIAAVAERVTEADLAEFRLSRTVPRAKALEVRVAFESSTSPDRVQTLTVRFPPGQGSVTRRVQVGDNNIAEDDVTVTWTLEEGEGYTVSAESASASVVLEENDVPEFAVSMEPAVIAEGETSTFTVAIANGVRFRGPRTIALAMSGTASASDYTGVPATLRLDAYGSRPKYAAKATLTASADREREEAETVTVTASHNGSPIGSATVTILANDAPPPLTAQFVGLPETHDGETEFSFELRFSEELDGSFSYATLRDAALEVTGGTMWEVGQSAPPSNRRWTIRVQPSPEEDLRLALAATVDCEDANAICTGDGRPLSNSPEASVRWVDPGPPAVSIAAVAERISEADLAEFRLSRTVPRAKSLEVRVAFESSTSPDRVQTLTVRFPPGQGSVTRRVQVGDNNIAEDDVTVTWTLEEGEGYTVSAESASASVVLEENDVPEFAVSVEPAEIAEGETATLTVAIANGVRFRGPRTIALAVSGTASSGSDYTGVPATLRLDAFGSRPKYEAKATLAASADREREEAETVTVTASHNGSPIGSATVTILADDAPPPLTAQFVGLPETHDGETEFSFELRFSEELDGSFSYATLRDAALEVTGGSVREAGPLAPPSNQRWDIRVVPESEEDMVLVLPLTTDCSADDAICTEGGEPLSTRLEATVKGPAANVSKGFELVPENGSPSGLWSDGETAWVADVEDGKLYAYRRSGGERQPHRDIATGPSPMGLWSDGETLWVAGLAGGLRAHRLPDGSRLAPRDLAAAESTAPAGVWSDGETAWVTDWLGDTVRAYRLSDGKRLAGRDIALAPGNLMPLGLWSDGETLWVADWEERLYAYRMADGERQPGRDITAGTAADSDPSGLWSDGGTLLTTSWQGGEVHAHRVPEALADADRERRSVSVPAIPDPALRRAVEAALGKAAGEALSVADLAGLQALEARNAGVTSLAGLEGAVSLRELDLGFNPLTDLGPLAFLPSLESLNLDGSRANLGQLAPLVGLKRLSLRHNGLDTLEPLAVMTSLIELDVGDNRIEDLHPLMGLGGLRVLRSDRNRIADLWPLSYLANLEALDLGENRIRDLHPLAGLGRLTSLRLSGNGLSEVYPLAGLKALRELVLAGNAVEDLSALSDLPGLRRLDLRGNTVRDLRPLQALPSLVWVHVGGSRIDDLTPLDDLPGLTVAGHDDLDSPGASESLAGQASRN